MVLPVADQGPEAAIQNGSSVLCSQHLTARCGWAMEGIMWRLLSWPSDVT